MTINPSTAIIGPYYQISYVTNNLDAAVQKLRAALGMGEFLTLRDNPIETGPGRQAVIHVALAYHGNIEMEVIEPRSGDVALYREKLPADASFNMHFHHYARLFETLEEIEAAYYSVRAAGVPIAIDTSFAGSGGIARVFYADYRPSLGHYIEFVHFSDAGRGFLIATPRY